MRRYAARGIVSLEENTEAKIEEPGDIKVDETESTEAALRDLDESSSEPDADAMMDVEEGGEAAEGEEAAAALESIADALAISAANGGMDKYSAAAVAEATQYIYKRVGIKHPTMPSLESFGGASTRIGATQYAMEGIKSSIAAIWKAIVDSFKRLAAWVVGHFNKIFGAAEKLQRRSVKIAEAADAAGSKKVKSPTFENSALVKNLHVGNDIPANLVERLSAIKTVSKEVLGDSANKVIDESKKIVAAFDDPVKKAGNITVASITKSVTPAQEKALGTPGDGMVWNVSAELPGGQYLIQRGVSSNVTGLEAIKLFGKLQTGIKSIPGDTSPTKTEVKTLKLSDIESIAKSVGSIADELIAFRATSAKLNDLVKQAVTGAENAMKLADTGKDAEKEAGRVMRSAAANIPKFIVGGFNSVNTYALRTGQAALNYCESSLKQYE